MNTASAGKFNVELFELFLDRHIALKPDWLQAALSYLDLKAKPLSYNTVCALVYEQWKCADLSKSTFPTVRFPHNNHFEGHSVLQVISCIDIATSAFAQLKKCTVGGDVDNAEFMSASTSDGEEMTRNEQKVRRMLKLKLSDGESSIDAIEFLPIPWLEPTILPGSKLLLLTQSIECRRGILLLTPKNCQKLGGQIAKLFANNLYPRILAKKVNKNLRITYDRRDTAPQVPISSPCTSLTTPRSTNVLITAPKIYSFGRTAENPNALNSDTSMKKNFFARPSDHSRNAPTTEESLRMVLAIEEDLSTDVFHTAPIEQQDQQIFARQMEDDSETQLIDDSFNNDDFSLVLANEQMEQLKRQRKQETVSAPAISEPVAKKFAPLSCLTAPVLVTKKSRTSNLTTPGSASSMSPSDKGDDFAKTAQHLNGPTFDRNSIRQHDRTDDSRLARDIFIQKFKCLSLCTIASAVKIMKYVVGSKRFEIVAIVAETVKPLRVVDDEWSMTLAIEDESTERLQCSVAHPLLCKLIGLTPQEATAIRHGTNEQRKRDGTNRITSIKEQLQRLDLIFTLEFFARSAVTPVICGLDTLTSRLILRE